MSHIYTTDTRCILFLYEARICRTGDWVPHYCGGSRIPHVYPRAGHSTYPSTLRHTTYDTMSTLYLRSPAFHHEGTIPSKYTCDGENISPPLAIDGFPEGTVSLVLIMDDHDVPASVHPDGVWDHWVVFNIPPSLARIPEDTQPQGVAGINTRGFTTYSGPCPPNGEHRYLFKVYALDTTLNLPAGSSKQAVLDAMQGHILEGTTLMGRYKRTPTSNYH